MVTAPAEDWNGHYALTEANVIQSEMVTTLTETLSVQGVFSETEENRWHPFLIRLSSL